MRSTNLPAAARGRPLEQRPYRFRSRRIVLVNAYLVSTYKNTAVGKLAGATRIRPWIARVIRGNHHIVGGHFLWHATLEAPPRQRLDDTSNPRADSGGACQLSHGSFCVNTDSISINKNNPET